MVNFNTGAVPLWNSSGTSVMSLAKMLLLSLVALSLKPSAPYASALKDPMTRFNNGTIIVEGGTVDRCISVDASNYFSCLDKDGSTEVFDTWLEDNRDNYTNSMYFSADYAVPPANTTSDPEKGIALFWKVEGGSIFAAMVARATPRGWVGFGLSESGGMAGSDVVIYNALKDEIEDGHVLASKVRPIKDERQASRKINSVRAGGFLIVEFVRPIDTEDGEDIPFIDDSDMSKPPSRFIAAWGDGDIIYHGPKDRLFGDARFVGDRAGPDIFAFREHMLEDVKAKAVELRYGAFQTIWGQAGEVPIFADSTRARCFEMIDLANAGFPTSVPFQPGDGNFFPAQKPVHIVGIERINDVTAEKHIRRVTLYKATAPGRILCRNTGIDVGGDYDTLLTPTTRDSIRADMIYSWGPGSEHLVFPENAGLLFGDKPMGLIMVVEYHNPNLKPRIIDHSGFRIYFTDEIRENNIGVATVGTVIGGLNTFFKNFPNFQPIELPVGFHEYTFSCPSNCTKNRLPEDGVTVVREHMSMNTSPRALRMTTQVNRDGIAVREGTADIYASAQKGYYSTRSGIPYTVLPGDSIQTKCYYNVDDTTEENAEAFIGNSGRNEFWVNSIYSTETRTSDEQCTSILYYYPAEADDIGLVCDVTTGRGMQLPPGNEDQKQEDQGCVAVHTSEKLEDVDSLNEFVEGFVVFGNSSGSVHFEKPSSGSTQLFQKGLLGGILAATAFIGLLV